MGRSAMHLGERTLRTPRPALTIGAMQFLFLLNLRSEGATVQVLTPELIKLEIATVKKGLASGTIGDAWMRKDQIGIIVLFDGLTEAECRSVVGALPFSKAKVLEIEKVIPVEPFLKSYP